MSKEKELLESCILKRNEIKSFIEKYACTLRWRNEEEKDLVRMICEYGDAMASHATEKCKQWMIKKLGEPYADK